MTSRSRWWVAPTVSTVITMPPLTLGTLITMFVGFAYDSCAPDGCPGTDLHVTVGLWCLLGTLPLLAGAWLAAARWRSAWHAVLCALAPALATLSVVSYLTLPPGQ
ncbi:hypothetical protein [Kitasatospora viridis]|uniref:Uncharacterized protein n=1 Tax=Kitasatospora viridis TaxID=281105 RepID=A0A561UGR7_9ACTN|nr:hypothetical protein [Kitasatospora viridis]TWF98546.1 hypothetical protein FHX73_112362 [Kitasatospora viridis]